MKLDIQLFADGKIVLETEVDTSGVDEGIKEIEDMDDVELDAYIDKIEMPEQEIKAIADELSRNLEINPETRTFDYQIAQLKLKILSLVEVMKRAEDFHLNESEVFRLTTQLEQAKNKLVQLEAQKKKMEGEGFFEKSGKSLSNIVGKVGKWGLMLIGIRSAYSMISQTANNLAQQNEEMAGKLQAIKGSLTNLLAPAVEVIINLVWRLLSYLNVITKTFLGIDLFAKTAKSAKSATGSAQKLRKTLAGFDEMNILNDNTTGAGGGSVSTPEPEPVDTSNFEKKVEKYKSMWEEMVAITHEKATEVFLEGDKTWGLLKLGFFDLIHGMVLQIQGVVDFIKGIFQVIKGIADGDTDAIIEGLKTMLKGLGEFFKGFIEIFILAPIEIMQGFVQGVIKTIFNFIKDKLITPAINNFNNFKDRVIDTWNIIKNKIQSIVTNIATWLATKFKEIGTTVGDMLGNGIKNVVNAILSFAENKVNGFIRSINKAIDTINKIPGVSINKLSTVSFPRLAKGGIVNMPSRGVPVGSAIAGERGAEGVIPLTDSQQMALLGEAIGRYITINANITNTMNGRIISRELQKINNENSFANNS